MHGLKNSKTRGFDYVADRDARAVILGSMPGVESLRLQQYYAHPRNLFWDFMGELFDAGRSSPYPERLLRLKQHHIALWDVARQCERSGSLDHNIKAGSIIPNDFSLFFSMHPGIRAVFLNGRKAAAIYRQSIIPNLPEPFRSIPCHTLPSTSPAHAAMSREEKLNKWLQVRKSVATLNP
ncbi:MAG: DNA-deoxyinosine glycosylase [Mariprofundaceae bacterium]|nr:DNA-deoxyinosine glycosylase [Mariprofundaceae bacterium]